MNFNLDCRGFRKYLIKEQTRDELRGKQYVFRFKNGYGASVVKGCGTYGSSQDLWELGVLRFNNDGISYSLDYSTKIINDVIGYQTDKQIRKLLWRIKWLRKHT